MLLWIGLAFYLPMLIATDEPVDVLGPERIEEFHVCVGATAYIPLPLNVVSRTGHESTIITLSFQRRHSEKTHVIATFNGKRKLMIEKPMADRLSISEENSGIYLKKLTIDDAGVYTAQARYIHDQQIHLWTRMTNLTVHIRPIIHNNRLNFTQSEVIIPYNKKKHCVNITCGTIEYPGYPPAKFVWAAPPKILDVKVASDDFTSSVQICSPFNGDVTCSVAGFTSLCTYDHVIRMHLDLPGPPANSSSLEEATLTRDLVLMIALPILAVAIPVTILSIWVLRHLLRHRPRYRNQPRHTNAKPRAEVDIEENRVTEQTLSNVEEETSEPESQTERKEEIQDSDNEEHNSNENNEGHPPDGGEEDANEEESDDSEGREEGESSEDENRTGEKRPLMEETLDQTS